MSSSWLPTNKLQNVFRVTQQVATKWIVFFNVIICYPSKSSYKMVSQPNHIKPHTALKKLLCYKMVALGTLFKPCFTDKVD
jgi:hypothetical protein